MNAFSIIKISRSFAKKKNDLMNWLIQSLEDSKDAQCNHFDSVKETFHVT